MYVSNSAAANIYLAADGFLNVGAIEKTAASIDKAMSKVEGAKPTGFFAISLKAKPGAYSAAKDKKRDFKYLATRMVKVAARKRAPAATSAKVIFTQYDPKVLGRELAAKQRTILSAIQRHMTKLPKEAEKIKGEKAGIREEAQKKHDVALEALTGLLSEAGFNVEANMVQSSGPFGSVTLLKVGKNEVVSIGKSDLAKFNAAKRANRSESASPSIESLSAASSRLKLLEAENIILRKYQRDIYLNDRDRDAKKAGYEVDNDDADRIARRKRLVEARKKMRAAGIKNPILTTARHHEVEEAIELELHRQEKKQTKKSHSASLSGDSAAKILGRLKKLHPKVQFEVEDAENWPDADTSSPNLIVAELKGHLVYDVLKDVDASPLGSVKAAAKYWGLSEEAVKLISEFNGAGRSESAGVGAWQQEMIDVIHSVVPSAVVGANGGDVPKARVAELLAAFKQAGHQYIKRGNSKYLIFASEHTAHNDYLGILLDNTKAPAKISFIDDRDDDFESESAAMKPLLASTLAEISALEKKFAKIDKQLEAIRAKGKGKNREEHQALIAKRNALVKKKQADPDWKVLSKLRNKRDALWAARLKRANASKDASVKALVKKYTAHLKSAGKVRAPSARDSYRAKTYAMQKAIEAAVVASSKTRAAK